MNAPRRRRRLAGRAPQRRPPPAANAPPPPAPSIPLLHTANSADLPVRRAILPLVLILALGPAAQADPAEDLERAVALFEAGDLDGAAPLLERLHAADPASA